MNGMDDKANPRRAILGATKLLVERATVLELTEHIRSRHRRLGSRVIPLLTLEELEQLHVWLCENEYDCQEALW